MRSLGHKKNDKRPGNFKNMKYSDLNAEQNENYNFQKVAALLADYGFNCIRLSDDWQGADYLAYHVDGEQTLKVQLKSRLMIARKYEGKRLHIVFPLKEFWYLAVHDLFVRLVGKTTNWLNTKSWLDRDAYSAVQLRREPPDAHLNAAVIT